MEDPWVNAWGDSSKGSSFQEPSFATASNASWAAPSISALHGDNEDDLSAPSWTAQSTTPWNTAELSETSLWATETITTSTWNPPPSTFDELPLSSDSTPDLETHLPTSLSESIKETSSFTFNTNEEDEMKEVSSSSLASEKSPENSPIPSPLPLDSGDDIAGFGTFEHANSVEWTSSDPNVSLSPSDVANVWGSNEWEGPDSGALDVSTKGDANIEPEDAWENARRQKEKQDVHVPPELLASILQRFQDLSKNLWPDSSTPSDIDDMRQRVDIEQLGLTPISQRLMPRDLSLPQSAQFSRTFTMKQMVEALKHTRHSPLTRSSPMAFYMSSKGLSSWEASVKAKSSIIADDVAPSGWKIVESPKVDTASEGTKKKSSGGLLSFFGRRGTNPNSASDISNTRRPASPAYSISSVKSSSSPRPSIENIQPNDTDTQSEASASQTISNGSTEKRNSVLSSHVPQPQTSVPEVELSQPTVVSRFLSKFSRSRNSSSHESLSLSADDLEYLSDVPTFDADMDKESGLDALSKMIKAPVTPPQNPQSSRLVHPNATITGESSEDDFMSSFQVKPVISQAPVLAPTPAPSKAPQHNVFQNNQSWPSFDYPEITTKKIATLPNKHNFVPVMSSSPAGPSSTPLLPKPLSTFFIPPPPSFSAKLTSDSQGAPSLIGTGIPALQPPPSRPPTYLRPTSSPQTVVIDEDDEFSDFLSSPPIQAIHNSRLSFAELDKFEPGAFQSPPKASTTTSFDGFDDFVNAPPQPPSKESSYVSRPSILSNSTSAAPTTAKTQRKVSRAADHSKTLSLMENVATRGRWLGPPSPLPQALGPPPDSHKSTTHDGSSMQAQQAHALASLANPNSLLPGSFTSNESNSTDKPSWTVPLPHIPPVNPLPGLTILPSQPNLFGSTQVNKPLRSISHSIAPGTSSTSTTAKTGGLSAQDLSFFEGL